MYCSNCGGELEAGAERCGRCGAPVLVCPETSGQAAWRPATIHQKDPVAALLLGLLPGMIGFLGLGHFYAGAWSRGLLLLLTGWALILLAVYIVPLIVPLILLGAVVWLLQSLDAYRLAKASNRGRGWS